MQQTFLGARCQVALQRVVPRLALLDFSDSTVVSLDL